MERRVFSKNLKCQVVEVLSTMVNSKFTLLEMQVEVVFVYSAESQEAGFRETPEAFKPVHMRAASPKFILSIIDLPNFAVSQIDQAIIPTPLI